MPVAVTVPELGASSPAIRRSRVDLPEPLSPIRPVRPVPKVPERSSSTVVPSGQAKESPARVMAGVGEVVMGLLDVSGGADGGARTRATGGVSARWARRDGRR